MERRLSSMIRSVSLRQVFLTMPFSKSNVFLWQTVMLTYGSLVYRNCAYYKPCTMTTVQVRESANRNAWIWRRAFKTHSSHTSR